MANEQPRELQNNSRKLVQGIPPADAQPPDSAEGRFGDWDVSEQPSGAPVAPAAMPLPGSASKRRGGRTKLLSILGILLLLAGVGAISFFAGGQLASDDTEVESVAEDSSTDSAASPTTAATATDLDADSEDDVALTEVDDSDTAEPAESDDGSDAAGDESEGGEPENADSERPFVEPTENATEWPGYPPDPEDAPASGPYIIIKGGDFFLRGTLSSEELRQEMAWFTLEVVPAEDVVVEYQVDPDDPFELGDTIPVYFADVVLFDVNSERVNEEDLRDLALLGVEFLKANPTAAFTFIGYTDSSGDDDFNEALSLRRAEAVRQFYISLGSPPDQVFAVGNGEADPVADNSTEEGRAQNRRVEFKFTNEG